MGKLKNHTILRMCDLTNENVLFLLVNMYNLPIFETDMHYQHLSYHLQCGSIEVVYENNKK